MVSGWCKPWRVEKYRAPQSVVFNVLNADGLIVARVHEGNPKRADDNAHMIAAAPEMYSVLYEMFCEGPVDVAFAGNPIAIRALEGRIRAAIDNATAANSVGTTALAGVNP